MPWRDLLLLIGWLGIGLILRFANLGDKPASSIEISTLGFGLGHGFAQIPLNELIPLSTLLSPLKIDYAIDTSDVIHRLLTESTHPPLYFCLTHWWTKIFFADGELVSLSVGRSLSAVLGGLAIPAIFGFSWLAWRNSLIAHFAAILMAISPYGIYLAQEARHYTLSILWIIASLTCLVLAIARLNNHQKIPRFLSLIWIGVNGLGMATHYFFCLALALEGIVLISYWWWQNYYRKNKIDFNYWLPLILVGLGTLVGCLIWLPVAGNISSNELTDWIETGYDPDEIWQPLPRMLAWLITMVGLLPIEGVPIAIAIASGVILLGGMVWTMPKLISTGQFLLTKAQNLNFRILTLYFFSAIGLYLFLIYGYGKDVSLAARYHFVYFPVVLVSLAAILAHLWQQKETKKIVIGIFLVGFLGSLTVNNNLGFQKSRRANSLAQHIQTTSQTKTIIATSYETHSQLREAIALGLAFTTNSLSNNSITPDFLLLERNDNSTIRLNEILSAQVKPLDLWGVNLKVNNSYLSKIGCVEQRQSRLNDSGYQNRLYRCYK